MNQADHLFLFSKYPQILQISLVIYHLIDLQDVESLKYSLMILFVDAQTIYL